MECLFCRARRAQIQEVAYEERAFYGSAKQLGPDLPMLWQSQNHIALIVSSLLWDLAVIRGTMAWTDNLACPDFSCNGEDG